MTTNRKAPILWRTLDGVAKVIGRVVLVFVILLGCWLTLWRIISHFFHFPAPAFLGRVLDNPFRRGVQPPDRLMLRADIRPGMTVLEVGCGPGTFTTMAARFARPGVVHAVDIAPGMIELLETRLGREGVDNVVSHVASAYELPLEPDSVDRAFMVTVLGEIPDKVRALREIRRVMKPDALLAVSEFFPDPDYPRRRTVIGWCRAAGLELTGQAGGPIEYTLTFRPIDNGQ